MAPADFNWKEYLYLNPDVAKASHCSKSLAIDHWERHGHHENRNYKMSPSLDSFFNHYAYLLHNPDLVHAGITSEEKVLWHYILHGRSEKRISFSDEIQEYFQRKQETSQHWNKIESLISESKELLEGHICLSNDFIGKQLNLYHYAKVATQILEIGFNAGHSTLIYLIANPTSKIYLFDLGVHKYTRECFNYLDSVFPNRLSIIYGDSVKVIPQFTRDNPEIKFDLLHIDGGHTTEIATADLINCKALASTHNIVIFDDTDASWLLNVWTNFIRNNIIKQTDLTYPLYLSSYKHDIGQYII